MRPMLATPGEIPVGPDWAFEVKWDGMRALAHIDLAGNVRFTSRTEKDVTASFPELADLGRLGQQAVLDGEIVAFDADGRPDFGLLSQRFGAGSRRALELMATVPVHYVIFDLLRLNDESLLAEPYRERRAALAELTLPAGPFSMPEVFADGASLIEVTKASGLEGVIAKRWDSAYRPGIRSRDWIKHSHRTVSDAVVIGYRTNGSSVVSLALATGSGANLAYAGTAGSGLSVPVGQQLLRTLAKDSLTAPVPMLGLGEDEQRLAAAGFTWVAPTIAVEVRHLGRGSTGRFRQPVIDRVRLDLPVSAPGRAKQKAAKVTDRPIRTAIDGRQLVLNHLDKVLYPATGTTKAQVIAYYTEVAPQFLAWAAGRPITRRRWPDGVAAAGFFEKNLPSWAPDWIPRVTIPTSKDSTTFPVLAASDRAALVWLAAHSALELHTPQWRVADGAPGPPDRLVVDLDPGPGLGLQHCAEVAVLVRDHLADRELTAKPVLSGGKGLHLYATISGRSSDEVSDLVRSVGAEVAKRMPKLVVLTMAKAARDQRVFLDWSQNRAAKTTLAPWSLRGAAQPTVALPVAWPEVESGQLAQVDLDTALARWRAGQIPRLD